MYLKSIELFGFKSFAKKSELKFNSPISAIVGPNGSGKSNIAESFRFVLGEQSIKSLRGKKGEDLIFNGTGDMPRANRASVKVTFDNSTKFLLVDFETVVIERVVHRDSVNEYLINGSQVRLKDLTELLASAHIGSSGHHIISQGEADRILNASQKERKAMIEDALGLKLYQYKKQESERKLEKTRENIDKTQSLRREIAPHIRFLKKQVEKVQKTLELKEELHQKSLEYCNRENEYIKRTENRLNGEKNPLLELSKKLEKELHEAKSVLEHVSHKDVESENLIALEQGLRDVRQERDTVLRDFGRIDGELSSLIKMVKKQEEVATSYLHKTVTLVSVESLQKSLTEKIISAKNAGDMETILKVLEEVKDALQNFVDDNKDKVDMSLLADAQKDIENLKNSKSDIESKIKEIKNNEEKLSEKYNNLKNKIEKEKDTNREAERAIFRIMTEESGVRSKLHDIQLQEETLRLVKEDFKQELTELGMMLGTSLLQFEKHTFDYSEDRSHQEERRRLIEKIKIRLEDSGGIGGAETMKEYTEVSERDEFLAKEIIDLENSASSLTELIRDLNERLFSEFKNGIEKINRQFQEYFVLMFGGGSAKLAVVKSVKKKNSDNTILFNEDEMQDIEQMGDSDEQDGTDDGIEIEVSLPKKKVKGLMMLSGGERALTSIALIFAVTQVNPPPFIILDETDAALDEANSKKYADMVENLSKFSQLIVITHNRETMSRAGILYGVTMASGGGSKLLSVAFDEAVTVAK